MCSGSGRVELIELCDGGRKGEGRPDDGCNGLLERARDESQVARLVTAFGRNVPADRGE